MDLYCPKCREPWELDSLHDEVSHRFPDMPWYVENDPRCGIEFEFTPYGQEESETRICARLKGHEENPNDYHEGKHLPYDQDIHFNREKNKWHVQSIYSRYFSQVRKDFYSRGCVAMTWAEVSECYSEARPSMVVAAAYDLMGDDIDGAMAMMEDAQMLGLFDD